MYFRSVRSRQQIRTDRESEASHDLSQLLDAPHMAQVTNSCEAMVLKFGHVILHPIVENGGIGA